MQIGKAEIILNEFGSSTEVSNITPAEALVLHRMHFDNGKGRPVKNLVVLPGEAEQDGKKRTKVQEFARLKRRIHGRNGKSVNWVDVVFPGGPDALPETFEAVAALTENAVEITKVVEGPQAAPGGDSNPDSGSGSESDVPTRAELLKKKKPELEEMAATLKLEVTADATKEVLADAILAAVTAAG